VIQVYAVVDHPGPPLPGDEPLQAVASGGLALVCAPAGELAATPEALWHHEHVVEALMEERDLLPVRYGTRLADEREAARSLETRAPELERALDGVRGAVELSLRVLGESKATVPPAAARSGADYMSAKNRATAAQEQAMRNVHRPLESLVRAATQRRPHGSAELLRAAYLVERDRVRPFVRRVCELQREQPRLKLLCTGPWPAYSFSAT
jgi:hypothetical protein